jgi:diguanylate cyclase (GGDEF)-like protein
LVVEISAYSILKELLQVTSPFIRDKFLEQCVQAMSRLLGAEFAFVSRVLDAPATKVRVLAAWQDGAHKDGWDFDLSGTPCDVVYDSSKAPLVGAVLLNDCQILIPEGVCKKFQATRETSYQAFIGVPLWNRQAEMVGHIAVFFGEKLSDDGQATLLLEIMQVLAHRIEAELDRMLLEDEMVTANDELKRVNAQLLKDSITDPLTQISNRRYFNQRCKEAFARFHRSDEGYFLLLFDVDNFKAVNDRYGHDVGDQVLKAIADMMAKNLRAEVEVLARLGGEEFSVICHGVDLVDDAAALAERMRAGIAEQPLNIGGHAISITVSVGVAGPGKQDASWEDAYRHADQALYRSKARGRNLVSVVEGGA